LVGSTLDYKKIVIFALIMIELSVISTLLCRLLRTHNRVSLPGLGAFLVNFTPANLIRGGKVILPPSRNITFSAAETWNDGLLEQALAADQGYTTEGAQKQIAAFSQKLTEQLAAGRRIEFPELGIMRMTADREWRFTPLETVGVDADSFGLLELEMTPASPEPPVTFNPVTSLPPPPPAAPYVPPYLPPKPPAPVAEPPKRARCSVACWLLVILILLVTGGYVFRRPIVNFMEKSYYTPEQLAYLHGKLPQAEEPVTTTPPPVAAPAPVVEPGEPVQYTPAPRHTPKKEKTRPYQRFYIFMARFNDEDEAKDYAQRIEESIGYAATVIYTGDAYKVSVLSYASQQEAEEILAGLKSTDAAEFQNAWVEKY
jgi:nucleoid DNA-binding protein